MFAGISIQLEDIETDLNSQQEQINNITEDVDFVETQGASHNVRLDVVEADVDELERANVDIIDRLTIMEEIVLGRICSLTVDCRVTFIFV